VPSLETVSFDLLHPLVAASLVTYGLRAQAVLCDSNLADTAAFCAAYGVDPNDSANTLIVVGKGKADEPAPLAACLVLATTRLDVNGTVKQLLGTRKASFASQESACEVTRMEYGGVTVVGLPIGMALWIDEAVLARDHVMVGGGNRSSKLLLSPQELLKLPSAQAVAGLSKTAQSDP
jgi:prolyl-tRNA editing enzyme YbaK/EbsC (Cys-tRNA(Pro) deacylase)